MDHDTSIEKVKEYLNNNEKEDEIFYTQMNVDDIWKLGNDEAVIVGKDINYFNGLRRKYSISFRRNDETAITEESMVDFINTCTERIYADKDNTNLKIDKWYRTKDFTTNKLVVGYNDEIVWVRMAGVDCLISYDIKFFLNNHIELK